MSDQASSRRWRNTIGRATCANWRTSSTARWWSPKATRFCSSDLPAEISRPGKPRRLRSARHRCRGEAAQRSDMAIAGAPAIPMGAHAIQTESHSGGRTRTGHSGAQGNQRQPGSGGKNARHHPRHPAQAHRKVRHPTRIEYQVTEPSLLLLIPAYNEERRIEPVLRDYGRYFQDNYSGNFQLVVVLNGCRR